MPILCDTGAAELLRRRDPEAEKLALRFYPPVICVHVVGEFLYGQVLAQVSSSSLLEVREYLESFEVISPDIVTASIYARIRSQLKRRGITLPDPDYWIAAHAIQRKMPLASTDTDFGHIPEVRCFLLTPRKHSSG